MDGIWYLMALDKLEVAYLSLPVALIKWFGILQVSSKPITVSHHFHSYRNDITSDT